MIPDRRQQRENSGQQRKRLYQNGTCPVMYEQRPRTAVHTPAWQNKTGKYRKRSPDGREGIALALVACLIVIIIVTVGVVIARTRSSGASSGTTDEAAQSVNAGNGTASPGTEAPRTDAAGSVTEPETGPVSDPSGVFMQNLYYTFPSSISSRYGILIDLTENTVISEKNADVRTYPASVTKIMTVIVALENLENPEVKALITQDLLLRLAERYASVAGFQAGEWVSARDLMYAALLPSGADGSVGLAELVSGSEEKFAVLMNAKAEELGMTGTHFVNATGLHEEDHYSTCRDLAILLRYALQNDEFRRIFTTRTYRAADGLPMASTTFSGMEKAGLSSSYIVGGKTGYTPEAGVCLASLAQIGDREYIMITLGAGTGQSYPKYNLMDAVSIYDDLAAFLSTQAAKAA